MPFRFGLLIALALGGHAIHAQTRPQNGMRTVPFKGCVSFGQTQEVDAPKGTNKSVPISDNDARMLGYYESSDGIRLLAPRGWNCESTSGSGGAALFLSPNPLHHDMTGWHGLDGPVIEYNLMNGENSGRYEIARVIARVFPAYMSFARQTLTEMEMAVPTGPFASDTLLRKSNTVVEFTTPAGVEGLGNIDSWIGKSDGPISGVAMLNIDLADPIRNIPGAVILSVRLPPNLRNLAPAIIRYVESNGVPK